MEPRDFIDFEQVARSAEARHGRNWGRRRRDLGGRARVAIATAGLTLLVAPLAAVAASEDEPAPRFDEPVHIKAKATGAYSLRAKNSASEGGAARLQCRSAGKGCLVVRNDRDGSAAKFVSGRNAAPFAVTSKQRVLRLNADRVDGMHASEIVQQAVDAGAGGRNPTGPAGGDLSGTYPDPEIAASAVGTDEIADGAVTDADVAAANVDGAPGSPSLRTLGTGANQAAAGDDPRLSDSRTPTGAAGGDLDGTYPNPTLGDGVIDDASPFASSMQDGAAGTATLRSLGTGAGQAAAGNDPRFTDSRTPTGSAGGDLTGTYPNPTLGDGAIDSTSLFASSLRDGAAGVTTLRSLGTGANQAAAGNDPRLSDARTPTGPAGGDLTGTYPDPTLADGSVDSATIQDGSLHMNDIAAVNSSVSIPSTSVAGSSCAVFEGTSGDITEDDVIEIYPRVDDPGYPAGLIWASGTQNADTTIQFRVCNITNGALTASGSMPVSIYRR